MKQILIIMKNTCAHRNKIIENYINGTILFLINLKQMQ